MLSSVVSPSNSQTDFRGCVATTAPNVCHLHTNNALICALIRVLLLTTYNCHRRHRKYVLNIVQLAFVKDFRLYSATTYLHAFEFVCKLWHNKFCLLPLPIVSATCIYRLYISFEIGLSV